MKKLLFFLFVFLFGIQINYAQTTIKQESFEGADYAGYTTSIPFQVFNTGSDYFMRGDGSGLPVNSPPYWPGISNYHGSNHLLWEDNDGYVGPISVTLDAVTISGYTGLEVSFGVAAPKASNTYDSAKYIIFEYNIDGAGWVKFAECRGDGTNIFRHDDDHNGVIDGSDTAISNSGGNTVMQYFTSSIAGTGNSMQVRARLFSGIQEEMALDNFIIQGTLSVVTNTWDGSTDSNWNTAANWSLNSLPTTSTNVVIPSGLTNYPTATSAVDVISIDIASGASMIAQSSVSGDVTYNLAIPDTNWHLVSSPVVGETYDDAWITANSIASGSVTGTNRGIATYDNGTPDATTLHWRYFQTGAAAANFDAGLGYSNKRTAAGNYSFTGTFPTTGVSPAISQSDKDDNLLGNPYPSYLDIAAFITANTSNIISTHQAVYVWNGSTYTNLTTGYVHPGQAFFISSNLVSGTASITEAMQSHQTGVTFYRTTNPTINLTLSNGTTSKETQINYLDGKTIGLDPRFDVGMFKGVSSNLSVYTHLIEGYETIAFETQALPNSDLESMVVPVGVKANAGEDIAFSIDALNLPIGIKIFLEDKITNTFTRLDEVNTEYTITLSEALNGVGRFYVHTSASALGIDSLTLDSVSIYKFDASTLRIVGLPQGSTTVKVFNILGKQILSTTFEANGVKELSLSKLVTGIYIVEVQTEAGIINKKFIIE